MKEIEIDKLEKVIAEIVEWQKVTFPLATQRSRATHLLREAAELYCAPADMLEVVDIIFLALGMIDEAGIDLHNILRYKLEKNLRREWGTPDNEGVVEHIELSATDIKLDSNSLQTEWDGPSAAKIRMMLDGELPG